MAEEGLSPDEIMQKIAGVLEAGGKLYAGYPDGMFKRKYVLLDIVIPGLTAET